MIRRSLVLLPIGQVSLLTSVFDGKTTSEEGRGFTCGGRHTEVVVAVAKQAGGTRSAREIAGGHKDDQKEDSGDDGH